MIDFNKIVNKLLKRWWNIMLKEDIFDIIDPEQKPQYQSKVDKCIYRLKSEWIIISLKSWAYIIPLEDDKRLNEVDLIDKYYIKLLKRYISLYVGANYYIWWKKALEIHLKDYSIPEKITIINRSLDKKILVGNYSIVFKTVSWKENGKKINLYTKLQPFTELSNIDGKDFRIAQIELALLEAAMISDGEWVNINILNKTIKKYSKFLKKEHFEILWKYKFIMPMNRLKEISKPIDKDLYRVFLEIIKQNGWLFIWEWLRWF